MLINWIIGREACAWLSKIKLKNFIEHFWRLSTSLLKNEPIILETWLSMQFICNKIKVPVFLQGYGHHYFSNAQCYSLNRIFPMVHLGKYNCAHILCHQCTNFCLKLFFYILEGRNSKFVWCTTFIDFILGNILREREYQFHITIFNIL